MARIPDYTALGNAVPTARRLSFADQAGDVASNAALRLAGTVSNIADAFDEKSQLLARAKDANAYLDHQIATKQLVQTYSDRIATGDLKYEEAQQKFQDDVRKIKMPEPQARGAVAAENIHHGVEQNINSASFEVGRVVNTAKERDLQSQGAAQLDSLGKLAGMPDANIEEINKQADVVAPLLRTAGLNPAQVSKTLQDFKDRNWLNQATQRAMQSKDSLSSIKSLEHDLTAGDGFYAGKLDTDKRNSVLRQVINDKLQIENRMEREADKREIKAERAVGQMNQQIASGVPATAEMWDNWQSITHGTTVQDQFRDMQRDEAEVQQILRKPVADQLKYAQDKESTLMTSGGNVKDIANLARVKTAVQANVTQLQTNPLIFNANRNGQDVEAIDFSMLDDPKTAAQFSDRVATINAMQKQYGTSVPLKPLLPQEAQQLTAALNEKTPKDQAELFASLRTTISDPAAYRATMQQIAPDAPVKALAGMLAAKQEELTTGTHWFKPDDTVASKDVAAIMLQGESLLDPTKSEKGADGKPKAGLYLPESASLQADFMNVVGSAFAGRPQAAEIAFQAAKAYYVGKASQTGRLASSNSDIDTGLVQESIKAALGGVSNYNGAGEVLMPWGMDEMTFDDRVAGALAKMGSSKALADAGLKNYGDGTYYVTSGRNIAVDGRGQPIVIDLSQAPEPAKPIKLNDVGDPGSAALEATRSGRR